MLSLIASVVAWAIQAWILRLYIDAAVTRNWADFSKVFGVEAPAAGPELFCLDHCAAELPFIAGWLGMALFLSGFALLFLAWFKPRR